MHDLSPVLILLTIFGFIYAIVHLNIRRKERMALLEKGADPSVFDIKPQSTTSFKFGLLFIGVAVGILLGNVLEVTTALEEEVAYLSMIFLFGGLGLVINYIVEKMEKNKRQQ